jgi:phage shock protein E
MNSKYYIIIAFVLILIVILLYYFLIYNNNIISSNSRSDETKYKKITFDEMYQIINEKNLSNYTILDVRTNEEYLTGRLPNSILIPDYEIDTVVDKIKDKESYIFVYCRSGRRSQNAVLKMIEMGYINVYDVGGIIDYKGKLEIN